MPDARGRFVKGEHWRKPQAFRNKEWLEREYVERERSAGDIAAEFGVTDSAVIFWLRRHGIPRRSISEARKAKYWGASGQANPMFGKGGQANPNWRGGVSPERQTFYSSLAWADACRAVWGRDKGVCQRCGSVPNGKRAIHVHHIVRFSVREFRAEPSNLILLCGTCHRWVHSKMNTDRLFLKDDP